MPNRPIAQNPSAAQNLAVTADNPHTTQPASSTKRPLLGARKQHHNRWLIIAGFALLLGINQFLWLSFATIIISTQAHFGVNEFFANLLTLIFPIVFVLLAIHSGKILDNHGYKKVVSYAAVLMLVGSVIRWLGVDSYWIVFAGQLLIAIAQPYITNAINQVTTDWFDKSQLATVTGVIMGVMFLATALGAFASAPLIELFGFSGMLMLNMALTAIAVAFFLLVVAEKPQKHDDAISLHEIESLLKNKRLWLISLTIFIAMGYFNGLSNWIAPILEPRGIDEATAGVITAMLIIGGILGALIIPLLSDYLHKRRIFLIIATLVGALATYPLLFLSSGTTTLIISFVLGFFLLAGYPLLIAAAEDTVHPSQAAKAVAMLMLMGNLGGVVMVLSMQGVKVMTNSWALSGWVLIISVALASFLVLKIRDKPLSYRVPTNSI
ncbi:CynX/NimT family MFS transporter [Psychrobacter sp. FDAARGOS_221]|uniref:MFS transporter n=1 Tax=Psychrobacter sp. FDAARGOS_221 TaxID=1975705 RepID=UPI000BB5932A|nr:MFS transporter [Psychrobacter sp. FDAARGOS_221]PNK61063.1 MFS transporter [Psychrobacter sp. FDAARGOS_221]